MARLPPCTTTYPHPHPACPFLTLVGEIGPGSHALAGPALALGATVDFDPNARVGTEGMPLLHHVLRQIPPDSPEWPHRVLPLGGTPGSLGKGVLAPDLEWLAAWLLQAGADPWVAIPQGTPQNTPATALDWALHALRPALVAWLLDQPGAPSAAEFASRPCPFHAGILPLQSWWGHVCTQNSPRAIAILDVLAARGARPPTKEPKGPHALVHATEAILQHHAAQGWLPAEEPQLLAIEKAWRGSVAKNQMAQGELDSRMAVLRPTSSAQAKADVKQLARVEHCLGLKLNDLPLDGWTQKQLEAHSVVNTGPLKGHWTGLAALSVGLLRCGWLPLMDNEGWGKAFYKDPTSHRALLETVASGKEHLNFAPWVKQVGVLSEGLKETAGPATLPVSGLLGLVSLITRNGRGISKGASARKEWMERNQALFSMIGTTDPLGWLHANSRAMQEWTCVLVGSGRHPKFAAQLAESWLLWTCIVGVHPAASPLGWRGCFDLFRGLLGGFKGVGGWVGEFMVPVMQGRSLPLRRSDPRVGLVAMSVPARQSPEDVLCHARLTLDTCLLLKDAPEEWRQLEGHAVWKAPGLHAAWKAGARETLAQYKAAGFNPATATARMSALELRSIIPEGKREKETTGAARRRL